MEDYEYHEIAKLLPVIEDQDFIKLVDDIAVNGLHQPIVIYEGKILDGRHRYEACIANEIEPILTEYQGNDPIGYVLSTNIHRRHLTASQRAIIVSEMQDWEKAHPAHRVKEDCTSATLSENIRIEDRANIAGVGKRTQADADKIKKEAPELVESIKNGDISVKKAANELRKKQNSIAPVQSKDNGKPEGMPEVIEMDWHEEYLQLQKEYADLQTINESLQKEDKAAEITLLHKKYSQLEARLTQVLTTKNEAEKQAKYQAKILKELREHFGVEKNSEIIKRVKEVYAN